MDLLKQFLDGASNTILEQFRSIQSRLDEEWSALEKEKREIEADRMKLFSDRSAFEREKDAWQAAQREQLESELTAALADDRRRLDEELHNLSEWRAAERKKLQLELQIEREQLTVEWKELNDERQQIQSQLAVDRRKIDAERDQAMEQLAGFMKEIDEETAQLKLQRRQIDEERQRLDDEKARMQAIAIDKVVELNVGGEAFTTARATLCRCEGSLLASMFSGRWTLPLDPKGRYFIDRNPKFFAKILDFLRSPADFKLDLEADELEAFRADVDHYGLSKFMFPKPKPSVPPGSETKTASRSKSGLSGSVNGAAMFLPADSGVEGRRREATK